MLPDTVMVGIEQSGPPALKSVDDFRPFLELSPDAIVIVNGAGNIVLINTQTEAMFGHRREELLGQPLETLIPPRFRDQYHRGHGRRLFNSPPVRAIETDLELCGLRKNGSEFPAEISLSPLQTTDGVLLTCAIRDITRRKKAGEELRLSERRFSLLVDRIKDYAIYMLDSDGRVASWSDGAARMKGFSGEEVLGSDSSRFYPPEAVAAGIPARELAMARSTGHSEDRGWRVRKDGSRFWADVATTALYDHEGDFEGFGKVVHDITARRSDEQKIQEATRLKSEFLANMSHELRTPLNAIIGFTALIHSGKAGAISPKQQEYLRDILASSRHLLQLINDILDLSKVESGKMVFRPEPFELAKLIGSVRDILRELAAEKRILIELEVPPGIGTVELDPGKLKQVLYNYLSNAIKFTREGGKVTIRVVAAGDCFRLEVQDTGIGIQPEDLERLFVEFQQLDASLGKKYQGTGLGLALTKRIVEAQGGQVSVQSTPGEGSTFGAVLPRKPKTSTAPASDPILPKLSAARPKVLVIADDPVARAGLEEALSRANYRVQSVPSGAAALELCEAQPFGVIILDLVLSDGGGSDLLREIRATELNSRVPMIVLGASSPSVTSTAYDFLVKPIADKALAAALKRATNSSRSRAVLVVDHDLRSLRLTAAALHECGYPSVCRLNGEEALAVVKSARPAAIVLDLLLSPMSGFEFLDQLRQMEVGKKIPVIVWTVKELTEAEWVVLRAAAQAIIFRSPDGTAALLSELRRFLPRRFLARYHPSAPGNLRLGI